MDGYNILDETVHTLKTDGDVHDIQIVWIAVQT
jgi:hypothetical protein